MSTKEEKEPGILESLLAFVSAIVFICAKSYLFYLVVCALRKYLEMKTGQWF